MCHCVGSKAEQTTFPVKLSFFSSVTIFNCAKQPDDVTSHGIAFPIEVWARDEKARWLPWQERTFSTRKGEQFSANLCLTLVFYNLFILISS